MIFLGFRCALDAARAGQWLDDYAEVVGVPTPNTPAPEPNNPTPPPRYEACDESEITFRGVGKNRMLAFNVPWLPVRVFQLWSPEQILVDYAGQRNVDILRQAKRDGSEPNTWVREDHLEAGYEQVVPGGSRFDLPGSRPVDLVVG